MRKTIRLRRQVFVDNGKIVDVIPLGNADGYIVKFPSGNKILVTFTVEGEVIISEEK